MAHPKTKEEMLLQMRSIWIAFVMSIVLYVYIGETMPGFDWLHFKHAARVFVTLSILNFASFAWFRMKRHPAGVELAKARPHDVSAFRHWMTCWTVLMAMSESIAVFGLCFRMGGKTLQQTMPFYAVALLLVLSLWPRLPGFYQQ